MRSRQRGFSLVEVLTTLVVMSVGMLGIAGLYVQSMQAGHSSMFRHHAVTLAGDVADRIRANPTAGIAYTAPNVANINCAAGGGDCDTGQMAAHDIGLWKSQAADTLPAGKVTIVFDAAVVPPTYLIAVSWNEIGEQLSYEIKISVLGY